MKKLAFENETTQTDIIHQLLIEALEMRKNNIRSNKMELIVINDDLMDKVIIMSDVKKQDANELINDYIDQGLNADGINNIYREKIRTEDVIGIIEDDGEEWDIDKEVYE